MLKELKRVRQITGYIRRWFDDEYFDLICRESTCLDMDVRQLIVDKLGEYGALSA